MKVTAEMLRNKDACEDQVEIFEKAFPTGTRVTRRVCLRAAELGLNTDWFALNFLSPKQFEAFDAATTPHWKAYYDATTIPHWKAYKAAAALALWEAIRGEK